MSDTHYVIWNGTRNTAWGSYIFLEKHATIPPPPSKFRLHAGTTERLRVMKDDLPEWFTLAEAAKLTGTLVTEVGSAVGTLVMRGEIEKKYQLARGKHVEQRYRWVGR